MKNLTKALAIAGVLSASAIATTPASAWWGGPGWGNWGDGIGDMFGDGAFNFNMSGSARGRGYGRGYGYDYYGPYGPYAYGPYGYAPYAYGPYAAAPYGAPAPWAAPAQAEKKEGESK